MKRKLSKIFGVGVTIALLASLLVVATPASGAALSFSAETDVPKTTDNILGPAGVDIVSLGVGGSTIYAAAGATVADNASYKSTNSGATWATLYVPTKATAKSIVRLAVAADDAQVVVAVSTEPKVYYTSNGGSTWTDLGIPATGATLQSLDVSPAVAGTRTLAVGGKTVDGAAEMWTLSLAVAAAWTARAGNPGFAVSQNDTLAVKFSPSYATDKIIAIISSNTTTDEPRFQVFRNEVGALTWNGQIVYFGADWGTGVALDDLTVDPVAADIAFPKAYIGTDVGSRVVFVSTAGAGEGGVTRLTDILKKGFVTWGSGLEGPISSIAYHESGKLLAGDYDAAQVYQSLNPLATSPEFTRLNTLKQPGGVDKTLVAWSGDSAVAATSGDESAFAVSTDSGYTFNDISLIDTTIGAVTDFEVSADGTAVYLAANSDGDVSIWKKGSSWQRVLSLRDQGNVTFSLGLAPENKAAIYVVQKGTNNVWVSKDSGTASWKLVPDYRLTTIQDFVVQSADTVYAMDTAGVTKSTNAGVSWGSKVTSDVTGHMITLAPNNDVLVGGSDGYVAFSKDAGATFSVTTVVLAGAKVYVVADKDYATNSIIYAGAGLVGSSTVKRGKADTTSSFLPRTPTIDATHSVKGIGRDGSVVYVLSGNASDSALHRALNLAVAATSAEALWSSLSSTAEFLIEPRALRLSSGPKLWAIDDPSSLYSATDPIGTVAATLVSPADKALISVNPGTGEAYNVTFTWKRQVTQVTKMALQIATDSAFTAVLYEKTFDVDSDTTSKVIGPTASEVGQFMPGSAYYWRVRVASDGPIYSPWTAARSFTVEFPVTFNLLTPVVGATDVDVKPILAWTKYIGALRYEVAVAEDPTFAIVDVSRTTEATFFKVEEELRYATTYYWRVRAQLSIPTVVKGKQFVSTGPWVSGIFMTKAEPVKPTPPVVVQPAAPPEIKVIEVPVAAPAPAIPAYLLWTVIIVGVVLIIALIVLIVRTRRV